jgi:hypothetical protein
MYQTQEVEVCRQAVTEQDVEDAFLIARRCCFSSRKCPCLNDVWRLIVIQLIARELYKVVCGIYFHPLSRYPGPRLAAASSFPALYWTFRGQLHEWTARQHAKYGPVVRLRPGELSFIDSAAWKDIYSFRQGKQQMPKILRTKPINGRPNIMSATDEDHAR